MGQKASAQVGFEREAGDRTAAPRAAVNEKRRIGTWERGMGIDLEDGISLVKIFLLAVFPSCFVFTVSLGSVLHVTVRGTGEP